VVLYKCSRRLLLVKLWPIQEMGARDCAFLGLAAEAMDFSWATNTPNATWNSIRKLNLKLTPEHDTRVTHLACPVTLISNKHRKLKQTLTHLESCCQV
jgi:hypothetical protein